MSGLLQRIRTQTPAQVAPQAAANTDLQVDFHGEMLSIVHDFANLRSKEKVLYLKALQTDPRFEKMVKVLFDSLSPAEKAEMGPIGHTNTSEPSAAQSSPSPSMDKATLKKLIAYCQGRGTKIEPRTILESLPDDPKIKKAQLADLAIKLQQKARMIQKIWNWIGTPAVLAGLAGGPAVGVAAAALLGIGPVFLGVVGIFSALFAGFLVEKGLAHEVRNLKNASAHVSKLIETIRE